MADEVRLAKADLKRPAPKASGPMAPDRKAPVTMQGLWRLMMWGATAAAALLIAVISSRGVVGSQRAAVAVATISGGSSVAVKQPGQATAEADNRPFDAQTETKRLSEAVRELASENNRLMARVGMVEHSVDDVTGSIAQQIKRAAAAAPAWPDSPPEPVTPANISAVVAPWNTAPISAPRRRSRRCARAGSVSAPPIRNCS